MVVDGSTLIVAPAAHLSLLWLLLLLLSVEVAGGSVGGGWWWAAAAATEREVGGTSSMDGQVGHMVGDEMKSGGRQEGRQLPADGRPRPTQQKSPQHQHL